jgi:phosphotransacetylase
MDRRIEKLWDEIRELEQQEDVLLEQQGRECRAAELAQAALALAREVAQIAACGTVEEKRTFVRAFLREIELDPQARTGTACFCAVPSVNGDTAPDPGSET